MNVFVLIIAVATIFLIVWKKVVNFIISKLIKPQTSQNFIVFYFPSDEKIVNEVLDHLEDNYQRILNNLHQKLNSRIVIKIYPNLFLYHLTSTLEINKNFLSKWFNLCHPIWEVANTDKKGIIHVVSPINSGKNGFTYEEILKIILHEFIHVVCFKINNNINGLNFVLSEGLAQYMSDQRNIVIYKEFPKSISEMAQWDESLDKNYAKIYTFGFLFVQFIIEKYGYNKFLKIYKKNYTIENLDYEIKNIYNDWIKNL